MHWTVIWRRKSQAHEVYYLRERKWALLRLKVISAICNSDFFLCLIKNSILLWWSICPMLPSRPSRVPQCGIAPRTWQTSGSDWPFCGPAVSSSLWARSVISLSCSLTWNREPVTQHMFAHVKSHSPLLYPNLLLLWPILTTRWHHSPETAPPSGPVPPSAPRPDDAEFHLTGASAGELKRTSSNEYTHEHNWMNTYKLKNHSSTDIQGRERWRGRGVWGPTCVISSE